MPACATQEKIPDRPTNGNLFLPVPNTDFHDYLDEVAQLLRFAPEIIIAIETDQNTRHVPFFALTTNRRSTRPGS